ncbi:MAG: methylated-DNA--[protein]-cysteine S-methyltransferase [Deltaproteobacteria bacterium]|nr:methylated-DNA--[protein]-cysteine S-methyltransferase [Deltaproteobacteria bacterium]
MTGTIGRLDTPWGPLTVVASVAGLLKVSWGEVDVEGKHASGLRAGEAGGLGQAARIVEAARDQLSAYLAGQRRLFDVPLVLSGTSFQVAVWGALGAVSYGCTWSYGDLARHLGRPHAARAVGAALRKNPIGIIVPCHRVIGGDGSLVGYAGGLEKKRGLLELERQAEAFSEG